MKDSQQDNYYLQTEGNNFFERNFANRDLPELRDTKKSIFHQLQQAGIVFSSVLEYGCNYGDLLQYFLKNKLASQCAGVEASSEAIAFSRKRYASSSLVIEHGTIAQNPINKNPKNEGKFDLVLVDDVFGWVSRETLLQSVANIDNMLADGGYLFIRDFYPDKRTKNQNHHVADGSVFNFKVPGSHAQLFISTGMYEIHRQQIYFDQSTMSSTYKSDNPFNTRWVDVILKKSVNGFFSESKKL